jgi:hypothetical protein
LSYAKVLEHWLDDYTVELFNESDWETDYSVLRFAYEPHKTLKDFQCIHLGAHERVRLCFDKKEEQEK